MITDAMVIRILIMSWVSQLFWVMHIPAIEKTTKDNGTRSLAPNGLEIELAKLITDRMPSIDRRFDL